MEHPCHVDLQNCEIVAAMATRFRPLIRRGQKLELPVVRDALLSVLPCPWCREVERSANQIARVRLGRHERNILLYAPPPESPDGAILDPSLKTHSDRETYLRAVRKLSRAGLLRIGIRRVAMQTTGERGDGTQISRVYSHRTMWITPFGQQVVACYRNELEEGRAVRWALHTEKAMRAARLGPGPLLERLADGLALQADHEAVGEGFWAEGVSRQDASALLARAAEAARAKARTSRA